VQEQCTVVALQYRRQVEMKFHVTRPKSSEHLDADARVGR
jgi:hypothetical protein